MNGYYTLAPAVAAAALDLTRALCTKSNAFSLVVAKVLAYDGPISTDVSCNDNLVAFTGISLDEKLDMLSKVIPLDTSTVRDYVRRYVKWRYAQAVGTYISSYGRTGSEVEDFFSVSHYFDKETIAITKECPDKLTRYDVKVFAIYTALMEAKRKEAAND